MIRSSLFLVIVLLSSLLLLSLLPIVEGSVEQQQLEPSRKLRRDSYYEAIGNGNDPIDSLEDEGSIEHIGHFSDFWAERPSNDAIKCCVCKGKTEEFAKCATETFKVKRNKLLMKIDGETCETLCLQYGRVKDNKIEGRCPDSAPQPCSTVPVPAETQTCCHCSKNSESKDGEAVHTCVIPTRKVFKRHGFKIGGDTCENSCAVFGRAEWKNVNGKTTSRDGYCKDEEYETLCAAADSIPTDIIPIISKGLLLGRHDGFDVLRWINTHFVSIAVDPDVVAALEHLGVEVDAPEHSEPLDLHSSMQVQQSFEDRISFFYSTTKTLESAVVYALKFAATAARLQHHLRTAMIFAHISGELTSVVSMVFMPLQITLHLFVYTMLPWNHLKESTLGLLHFSSRVVATMSCVQHRLRSLHLKKLSSTMKSCSANTQTSILKLLERSRSAAIDLLSNVIHVAACFGSDVSGFSQRICYEKVQNSLTDAPTGLFTEIALRLQIYADILHAMLEHDDEGYSEASALSATMSSVFNVLRRDVHERFLQELKNAFNPKPVSEDEEVDLETVCSAGVLFTSFHTKLFEAFSRTIKFYMGSQAGKRWRFPSVELMSMDGTLMEALTTIHPCKDVFDTSSGLCKSTPKHYDFAMTQVSSCSQAMSKGGPLWSDERA